MYIHVKVTPNAKEEQFEQVNETHFVARVREPAERNQANKRVLELVQVHFTEATRVHIVSGHHSPSKLLVVDIPGE